MKNSYLVPAFAAALIFCAAPALGEWSGSASSNLSIADGVGESVQAKIVPAPDGGAWISWFDNSTGGSGGYDVRVQRLDASGNEVFEHNGVLVAARPNMSSTQDYGLAVDEDGNAYLAYRVMDTSYAVHVQVQKIALDGTLPWSENPPTFGNGTDYLASPDVTVASDDQVVAGWTTNDNIEFVRLNGDGESTWGAPVVVIDPDGQAISIGGIHASNDGAVIASYVRGTSFFGDHHLYALKLNSAGEQNWNVPIFDAGRLQLGHFPSFLPDGSGGAIFTWYSASPAVQSYVQHVTADGTEMFTHNGVEVATGTTNLRSDPTVAYAPKTGDIFVFWTEATGGPEGLAGMMAQKIDAAGTRVWGENGVTIEPMFEMAIHNGSTAVAVGDSAIFFYSSSAGYEQASLYAARVDTNGKFVWDSGVIKVSSSPTSKSRLDSLLATQSMAMVTWQDAGTGDADILAQNVNSDGRLGNHTPIASDGTLTANSNETATGTLKATRPGDEPIVFSIVSQAKHGEATITDSDVGEYTYVPDTNYIGSDSFVFKASNGSLDSNEAIIAVTVQSVNTPPKASDISVSTSEGDAVSGTLSASDADKNQALTFSIVTQPAHGTVKLDDAASGAFTYTPNAGYSGADTFTYKASDGEDDSNTATVSIEVKAAADDPAMSDLGGSGAAGPLSLLLFSMFGLVAFMRRMPGAEEDVR